MVYRVVGVLLLVAAVVVAVRGRAGGGDEAMLERMLAAWERGNVDGTAYYSDTSADVQAYYLLAYAWAKSVNLDDRKKHAERLKNELFKRANTNGDCIGWGLGKQLDAFSDGTVNPASTIYLYTTARVAIALVEAERNGLISNNEAELKRVACSFKTLFAFDPEGPTLHYSDNENDNKYVVYNVFADLVRSSLRLAERLKDPTLNDMAGRACGVLVRHTRDNGYLPYFQGRDSTDATHHAMVVNGLLECQDRLKLGADAVTKTTGFLISHFIGPDGGLLAANPDPEWAAGEALIALTSQCSVEGLTCSARHDVLNYIRQRETNGLVNNNDARFQSWLAAGLAFALNDGPSTVN